MLGLSYGQVFVLLGATAALIGPKDLPIIARTAGRIVGRAIAYVQLARGQFDSVMQQSQTSQVHRELRDTMAQLEAIRHEIRSVSFMNAGPMTRRVDDIVGQNSTTAGGSAPEKLEAQKTPTPAISQDDSKTSEISDMHRKATAYSRLASTLKAGSKENTVDVDGHNKQSIPTLPISAESAGLLPARQDAVKGSDIVLEAILEADTAHNAKEFFSKPENHYRAE